MIKRRGVSLPELLVVLFLVAVMAGLGLGAGQRQPQAQALAGEVTAQLRAARQRAMARQERVGLVFPGPVALSATGVQGPVVARGTRTHNWAGEYPRARLVLEPVALSASDLAWLGSWQTLPAVIFDPQGRAHGLRRIGVAGSGPQEILISAQGTVTTGPAALELPAAAVSAPLRVEQTANHDPVIRDVLAEPTVGAQLLPAQVTAIVPNGGHATLTVRAQDEDGDRLYVTWECDPDQGFFSTPGEQPMVYDGQHWVGVTQFRPVETLAARTRIELRCRVRDEEGRLNSGGTAASRLNVAVGLPGKLAFWGIVPGTGEGPGLWVCSPEGHCVRQVLPHVSEYATVTWDGSKAVFGNHETGVFVANLDGSERTEVLPAPFSFASYSPNGKFLAAFHMAESPNPYLSLPAHLRKAANHLPWYPDRLVILDRQGVRLVDQPVAFNPTGTTLGGEFPTVTLPQIIWSSNNHEVYFLWGKRQAAGLPLMDPMLRTVPVRDPAATSDIPWPVDLGLQMHGSPTPMEIRSNDEQVLKGVRPASAQIIRVREWAGGGKARRPAGSSLYDGKSVILSGFREETENVEGGVVLALWRQGEETACRLILQGVQPFNDVITWTE